MSHLKRLVDMGPEVFSKWNGDSFFWPLIEEFCELKQKADPEDGVFEFRVCLSPEGRYRYSCKIWLDGMGNIYEEDGSSIMEAVSKSIVTALPDMEWP